MGILGTKSYFLVQYKHTFYNYMTFFIHISSSDAFPTFQCYFSDLVNTTFHSIIKRSNSHCRLFAFQFVIIILYALFHLHNFYGALVYFDLMILWSMIQVKASRNGRYRNHDFYLQSRDVQKYLTCTHGRSAIRPAHR